MAKITTNTPNGNITITPNGTGEVDISKVDIDGGTIDGTTIGGTTPAAGTFTTFTSTGIDDNLTSGGPALTIDSSGNVGIGATSPATALDVSGTITIDTKSVASNPRLVFDYDASTGASFIEVDRGTNAMEFWNQGSERMRIDSSGNLKFDSGYGSVATAYGCRAWVNFNGTGTVAIQDSGNVSSITDTATGRFTVNFTNAMPDANYAMAGSSGNNAATAVGRSVNRDGSWTTTAMQIRIASDASSYDDYYIGIAVFR